MKQSLSLYINQPIVLTLKLYYPSSKSAKEQLESERIMSQNQLPEYNNNNNIAFFPKQVGVG